MRALPPRRLTLYLALVSFFCALSPWRTFAQPAVWAPFFITASDYVDLDGDHDSFPDGGETGRVAITLTVRNLALTEATFVLVTSDPDVDCITERRVSVGDLVAGQSLSVGSLEPSQPGFTFKASDTLNSVTGADPARIDLCLRVAANELQGLSEPACFFLLADLDLPAGVTQTFVSGPDGITPSSDDGTVVETFDINRDGDGDFTVNDTFRMTDAGTGLTEHGFYLRGSNILGDPNAIPGVPCGGFSGPAEGNAACILSPDFPIDWHLHCPPGATNCPNSESGPCVGIGEFPCSYATPIDGQKAVSPPNSLHMAAHFSPFDSVRDTTHFRTLQAFVSPPINLALFPRPGDLELSMFHIARLMDNNGVGPGNEFQCVDCADVQVQSDRNPEPAIDDWGLWEKLVPFQNVYDHMVQAWSVFSDYYCEFTPGDTGMAPPAPRGVHETMCYAQGAWSHCGSVRGSLPTSVGDCAGPGVVDPSGTGVWVETKFNLASYLGQRLRIRWIGSTWSFGPGETCYECSTDVPPTITADDGWWLDDIKITGVITTQISPSPDTDPIPGTACSTLCPDIDGDGYGAPGDALCAAGSATDCDDLDASVHPGAIEVCNGLDDDCDGVIPADEADTDGDRWIVCNGDCDDADPTTYPGAPEVNDGRDNQCPGNAGYGLIDEISGVARFQIGAVRLDWTDQPGAITFLVARSDRSDLAFNCTTFSAFNSSINDFAEPPVGMGFYYLVRAETPNVGSWGEDSSGVERTICIP